MSRQRRTKGQIAVVMFLFLLIAAVPPAVRVTAQGEPRQSAGQRYALLVGVTEYPNLARHQWLEGPANDVRLMADVLQRAPFSVPAGNITTLSASPSDVRLRPTRANIAREFQRLAETARQNDQVVILMAGHGSQQPANDDPADEEPDGMDEIFLPADVGAWNGATGHVDNAIVDDDIRAWVTAIRNKGAFVWLIFDSCQSGTMARGINIERDRRVMPATLKIPDAAFRMNPGNRQLEQETQLLGLSPSAGGIAAIYAAEMRELTPETRLPNATSPWQGLFTYTIASVLQESRSPLTYRDLVERVIERYRSEGRYGPNPMFEGGGIDRNVLEQGAWPVVPALVLGDRIDRRRWGLRAGTIQGVTVGSILEMFPTAGAANPDVSLGFVRVVSAEATNAVVESVPFEKAVAAPENLGTGNRGRIVAHDLGVNQLRLAVQVARAPSVYEVVPPRRGPARLEAAIADLPRATSGLARRVTRENDADWVLRVVDGEVVLLPASGWNPAVAPGVANTETPQAFRVAAETDPNMAELLRDHLRRVVRARNLLQLARPVPEAADSDVKFAVGLVRYENGAPMPVAVESGGRTVHAGETVAFTMENHGTVPIDITLLLVDTGFGIESIFPPKDSATAGRLDVGQTRLTQSFTVTAEGVELDQVVAIAVRAANPPINFGVLAQPTLESMRSASRAAPGMLETLLTNAMFGGGATRALASNQQVKEYAVRLITWRAMPRLK